MKINRNKKPQTQAAAAIRGRGLRWTAVCGRTFGFLVAQSSRKARTDAHHHPSVAAAREDAALKLRRGHLGPVFILPLFPDRGQPLCAPQITGGSRRGRGEIAICFVYGSDRAPRPPSSGAIFSSLILRWIHNGLNLRDDENKH